MNSRTIIATAGNVFAPALGVLRELGYSVERDAKADGVYRAEKDQCSFIAEDPLMLLGLVKLYEVRGDSWQPSDSEISDLLALERRDA